MAIIELYSKKQKRLRGELNDVYQYDEIPNPLRIQIVHILKDCIGKDSYGYSKAKNGYKFIKESLCREYGVFELGKYGSSNENAVLSFLLETPLTGQALDVIDLSFRYIDKVIKNDHGYRYGTTVEMSPMDAIDELNVRFKEQGVGYQFQGELIKLDSTFIHSEVVIPTLSLLSSKEFDGPNDEYLKAHDHYKHGRNAECLTLCNNAFESTMKIICKQKGWVFSEKDTSKRLIQICFDNGLIPSFMQNQFNALRNLLEGGIPTLRNNLGSHGKGDKDLNVEDHFARYGLNLTGANIIFLIEQSDRL